MSLSTRLDSATAGVLADFHFDEIPFDWLCQQLENRGFERMRGLLPSMPDPLSVSEVAALPRPRSSEHSLLWRLGMDAIEAGQVATIVLNGGMSTRFGGVSKGACKVYQDKSLLYWKLKQVLDLGQGRVPILLMNSFATSEATRRHLAEIGGFESVVSFDQFVSLRLTSDAKLYRDKMGKPSLYAPGHGDLPFALKCSGCLQQLMAQGVKWLVVSNVDNLGATLSPALIGRHVACNQQMTVELVCKKEGDAGGFAAKVDGKPTLVEGFRTPEGFDFRSAQLFNTNSFVFNTEFLARDLDLDWFAVTKVVDDQQVVQFERLVGGLADFCEVNWILVERDGVEGRFFPIKTPRDLEDKRSQLKARLEAF